MFVNNDLSLNFAFILYRALAARCVVRFLVLYIPDFDYDS